MTEFEQQVADALLSPDDLEEIAAVLDPAGHYAEDDYLAEIRSRFQLRFAPRVAAAIHAAASYSDSSRPEIERFALGALRGVPK